MSPVAGKSYRTAEQAAQLLEQAAAAVRAALADDTPGDWSAGDEARRLVDLARYLDGTSPAQIAARAGLRQLVVAGFVDDERERAAALLAARHDAERYLAQVMATIRRQAVGRWRTANGEHGAKATIARDYGLTRTTLDEWIATHEETTMTTFDQVVAYAREQYGPTAASFDHAFGIGLDSAEQWMDNALWHFADADSAPTPEEARLRVQQLRVELASQLAAFRDACRTRQYVGWSRWTSGPVRYAEEADATRHEREVQVVRVTDTPDVD